ncbi:MAG: RsmD family RNA methyltransferase [Bacteroidetes bacterium]|nr:RsmD family RNA methyltransferase [Bacteroidota bacterium]
MRIISGHLKSRTINVPKSVKNLRPTTDRARETLFNLLASRFEIEDKNILDLFCGSGGLGLECLSRGSARCTFVDLYPETVKANIRNLALEKCSAVVKSDAVRFLKSAGENEYDIIFADPPYEYGGYEKLLDAAEEIKAFMILEHSDKFSPQERHSKYLFLRKEVGMAIFSFFDFKKKNEE